MHQYTEYQKNDETHFPRVQTKSKKRQQSSIVKVPRLLCFLFKPFIFFLITGFGNRKDNCCLFLCFFVCLFVCFFLSFFVWLILVNSDFFKTECSELKILNKNNHFVGIDVLPPVPFFKNVRPCLGSHQSTKKYDVVNF